MREGNALTGMKHQTHSPLALPFEQALEPSKLLAQMKVASEHQLLDELAAHGNRAFGAAIAGAKVVMESGTIQVIFEGAIPAGAKLMKSAGKALPVLVDGKTHQTIKIATVASKGRAAASIAANSALIVVEAAHMISGHDNAKRLKKVERSVDRLVHAHESELKSRLEAIYRYCKELLHEGPDALTEHDRRTIHLQCREIMELRARWRDGFRYQLIQIDRADAGWWNKVLWWRRDDAHAKSREQKAQEATDALEVVQLMHFSLMLQMALAGSAGKLEAFRLVTLEEECNSWRSLAELGRRRAGEIAGLDGAAELGGFLDALDELVVFWSPDKWREQAIDSIEPTAATCGKRSFIVAVCFVCRTRNRVPKRAPAGKRAVCARCKTVLC